VSIDSLGNYIDALNRSMAGGSPFRPLAIRSRSIKQPYLIVLIASAANFREPHLHATLNDPFTLLSRYRLFDQLTR